MVPSLTTKQVRWLRTRAQRLWPRSLHSWPQPSHSPAVTPLVRELCALQAQEAPAAALAVRLRCPGVTAADVEKARVQTRSLVRTWCMRGTLHLLATADLGWLLPLLGPVFIHQSRRRRAELGLDEETSAQGAQALQEVLARRGPLTRAQLVEALAGQGIELVGQAAPHLLRYTALKGTICFGPERDTQPTYVLLRDWIDVGPALPQEEALAELARRYLQAYGPAAPEDLASWSGLTLTQARSAWQHISNELLEVEIEGQPAWMLTRRASWLEESPPALQVHLLPQFDACLLGYRRRDWIVAPHYARRVHPGGGLLRPTLLVDGRAAGTWKSKRYQQRLQVIVEPFADLGPGVRPKLEAEVVDIGRFLEIETTLKVAPPSSK